VVAELPLKVMANALPLARNWTVSCAVTFTNLVLAPIGIVRVADDSGTTTPIGVLGVNAFADKCNKPDVIATPANMTNLCFITFSNAKVRCDKSRYVFDDLFVVGRVFNLQYCLDTVDIPETGVNANLGIVRLNGSPRALRQPESASAV
jgi:hypothetical protein